MSLRVAIVSRDTAVREAAARAFSGAPPEWAVALHDEVPEGADVVVAGPDVDAAGTVAFDPGRPEVAVREIEERAQPGGHGRAVAVVGAVGGAGATAVALHLACEWGPRACYAEAGGIGGARWFDLPSEARTWLPRDEDVVASALPVPGGFRLLRAPDPVPPAATFPLEVARRSFERLVIDAGTSVVAGCDAVVLVTTPTRPAAHAARALLDAHADARWAVVVNRLGSGGQIMRAHLEAAIGRPVALELPCCAALRDAEDEARLLSGPWHRWRRAVARLAKALDAC